MPELSGMIQERIRKAGIMREKLAEMNGTLQVRIPYTVTAYSDDDQQMYGSQHTQYVTFAIKAE